MIGEVGSSIAKAQGPLVDRRHGECILVIHLFEFEMNLLRIEPFEREEAKYGLVFHLISSCTNIRLRF
jgi:hypothetical protein